MRLKGKSARRGRASGEKDYPLIKYTHSYPHARTRVRTYTQVPGKYAVLSLDLFVWCDAWSSVCHLVTRSGKWKDGKPLSPWWHHCAPESGTIYLYLDGWQTLFSVSFFFFSIVGHNWLVGNDIIRTSIVYIMPAKCLFQWCKAYMTTGIWRIISLMTFLGAGGI